MFWTHRRIIAASAGVLLGLAGIGILYIRVDQRSRPAVVREVGAAPGASVLSDGGAPLTRPGRGSALVVVPSALTPAERLALPAAMQGKGLGKEPLLWVGADKKAARLPGVRVATVRLYRAGRNIPAFVIGAIEAANEETGRQKWEWHGGRYESTAAPIRVTIDKQLEEALEKMTPPHGAMAVLNSGGRIVAMTAAANTSAMLWKSAPVGMAALPPLLALAVHNPQVRRGLNKKALSLEQIANLWGTANMLSGLKSLGFGKNSLAGQKEPVPALPAHVSSGILTDGSNLFSTPLELARSYLPFIDHGLLPSLSLLQSPSQPGHLVAGDFKEAFAEIPLVSVHGAAFRVWRPTGSYVLVLDPQRGLLAVLEGAATGKAVSVMQILAQFHDK